MYYVYVLRLKNGQFYTGFSKDLKTRVKRHNQRATVTTSRIDPKEVMFYAAFKTKKRALDFERYLKSSSGFAFRNKHLV